MTANLWARRDFFEPDHESFRESFKAFLDRQVEKHLPDWEQDGIVPREPWLEAGRQGFVAMDIPQVHGGAGVKDFRFNCVIAEETAKIGASSIGGRFGVHSDIVVPYLIDLCTEEQAARWLPGCASGELITAIAMTEPGTGSDLQGIRTTAVRDGDDWIINGSKTFISNGIQSDLVVVVARSDPDAGSRSFTLFVVERDMPGFSRGRNLDKIGLHGQDTAELIFQDVRVPSTNVLGTLGGGFGHLMERLPRERISIAVGAVAGAKAALSATLAYTSERKAFGKRITDFQNTQFKLAEMATEIDIANTYVDDSVLKLNNGQLSAVSAAKAKWWTTEMHKRVVDECLQLHGGYGYMTEYPIARMYADTRVSTIYGGTTEIMKLIVARDLIG